MYLFLLDIDTRFFYDETCLLLCCCMEEKGEGEGDSGIVTSLAGNNYGPAHNTSDFIGCNIAIIIHTQYNK